MIRVYGSPLCPDCVEAKANLDACQIPCEFIDITASIPNLREFLNLRDHDAAFAEVKKNGGVGIPAVVKENGEITVDWEAVIREAGYEPLKKDLSGKACSLSHPENC